MHPQANPLSTYIDSTASFISPQPLAAASGLTIPLSITLSEIRLSAFIILVFSKQKGLTIVFRNDPLESLKVSSTFDSIQFVRDYLQRTIEGQLRALIMDQLPAIIHRLSLQLWCPGQVPKTDGAVESEHEYEDEEVEQAADPLASPPMAPVDANGNLLDEADVSKLSLDGGPEVQSMFAKLNLVSAFGLGDFNRSLMMMSPSFREVVFRGWNEAAQRAGLSGPTTPTPMPTPVPTPPHSKSPSISHSATTYTFSEAGSTSHGHLPSRPSLVSMQSATTGLSLGAGQRTRSYHGKKKKTRVVNLRRKTETPEDTIQETQSEAPATPSESDSASIRAPLSEPLLVPAVLDEAEDEQLGRRFLGRAESPRAASPKLETAPLSVDRHRRPLPNPLHMSPRHSLDDIDTTPTSSPQATSPPKATGVFFEKERKVSTPLLSAGIPGIRNQSAPSDIALDQQWIMKMASEIARRVYDEKRREAGSWDDAPPAYEASN
jgi:distribution and morphology protein 34